MLKERSNLCSARLLRAYIAINSGVPDCFKELRIAQADLDALRSILDSVFAKMQNARCRKGTGRP
jgi:hypothetical protein